MQRRGILLDSVLKSGGNEFHGDATFYGSTDALEGSNLTDEYRAVGISEVAKLHELWDVSATLGGRIIPNKLWFFAAIHKTGFNREILDAFNADGTPMMNKRRVPIWSGKLSYQMNQSHKFTGFYHTTGKGSIGLGAGMCRPNRARCTMGRSLRSGSVGRWCTALLWLLRCRPAASFRSRAILPSPLFSTFRLVTPILPRAHRSGLSIPSRR